MTPTTAIRSALRAGARDVARVTREAMRLDGRVTALGYEPLDLTFPTGPALDHHWVVHYLLAYGVVTDLQQVVFGPIACGFSIVRLGQARETLAQAQAGIADGARGTLLLTQTAGAVLADGTFLFEDLAVGNGTIRGFNAGATSPVIVPGGATIRYAMNQRPGYVNPGPGPGSWVAMQLLYSEERDDY